MLWFYLFFLFYMSIVPPPYSHHVLHMFFLSLCHPYSWFVCFISTSIFLLPSLRSTVSSCELFLVLIVCSEVVVPLWLLVQESWPLPLLLGCHCLFRKALPWSLLISMIGFCAWNFPILSLLGLDVAPGLCHVGQLAVHIHLCVGFLYTSCSLSSLPLVERTIHVWLKCFWLCSPLSCYISYWYSKTQCQFHFYFITTTTQW